MSKSEVDCYPRSRSWRPFVCAALAAAIVGLAGGVHAAGLFLPVNSGDAASGGVAVAKAVSERHHEAAVPVAWERRVRIAHRELAAARNAVEGAGAGRLQLDVKDGLRLDVVVERTAPTKGGHSLSGRVAGESVGFVTLVVHEEAVAGTIWTPNAAYELEHIDGGVHTLREVTNAQPIRCATAAFSEVTPAVALTGSGDDDGSVVDILIVWTPEYEEWTGEQDVLLHIDTLIAYTNDAFERSGALVSLNLVGARKLDQDGYTNDVRDQFGSLRDPNDGLWDYVHEWRDALGADLVHMLTRARGGARAGGAFGIGGHIPFVFAHEIGHNMGLNHDRGDVNARGTGGTPGGYAYGFSIRLRDPTSDAGVCAQTFMSLGYKCIGDEARGGGQGLPFYATPWRYHPENGRPLGVTRFSKERGFLDGPADAVLAINRNRHRVANLRNRPQ